MTDDWSLWMLAWTPTLGLTAGMLLGAYAWATRVAAHYNRRLMALVPILTEHGIRSSGGGGYSVYDAKNALIAGNGRLTFLDIRDGQFIHSVMLKDAIGLKVYETTNDEIAFRIMLRGGAESRLIRTRSTGDFSRLFHEVAEAGKKIEYIQE